MITPEDDFAIMAQGKIDDFLGEYNGASLSTEEASDYFSKYIKNRKESFKLAELPLSEVRKRNQVYKEMLESGSLQGGEKVDRMFMNNVRKGQIQAVRDLQKIIGKSVVPDELLEVIGPENAIRLLMRDIPKGNIKNIEKVFKESLGTRLKASTNTMDESMQMAKKYKAAAQNAKRKADKALYNNLSANELNKSRVEAGQSLGYVDGQERIIKQLKNKSDIIVINFRTEESMDDFVKAYPNNWKVFRGKKTVTLPIEDGDSIIKQAADISDERKHINSLRAGKFNTGGKEGYHPKGTKDIVEFTDKEGNVKKQKFRLTDQQETSMRFLKEVKSAILNSAPGTGKTPMSMSAISELMEEGKIKRKYCM